MNTARTKKPIGSYVDLVIDKHFCHITKTGFHRYSVETQGRRFVIRRKTVNGLISGIRLHLAKPSQRPTPK